MQYKQVTLSATVTNYLDSVRLGKSYNAILCELLGIPVPIKRLKANKLDESEAKYFKAYPELFSMEIGAIIKLPIYCDSHGVDPVCMRSIKAALRYQRRKGKEFDTSFKQTFDGWLVQRIK